MNVKYWLIHSKKSGFMLSNSKEYDDTDSASDCDDNTESEMSLSDSSLSSSFFSKNISRARWTKEEDERLRQVVDVHGTNDWKVIACFLPNRSELQCYHRWQKVLSPDLVKGPWTTEEDEKVVELVGHYGPKRWSLISKLLVGRTGKQCRERWHNHLNPDIKKSAWTEEEDYVIYEAHKKIGNRWAEIAKLLPGRTDNAIKNHWNSTMKRKVETSNPYTPSKPCSTPGYTQTSGKPANTSKVYTPDSEFMSANSIRDALKMRGPGQGVVRTLYPMGHDTIVHEKGESSKVDSAAPSESPSKWFLLDPAGEVSPFRDFHNLLESGTPFDDAKNLTFDLSPGMSSSTPIKFTHMTAAGTTDYHFDGQALSTLSKEGSGLIPITSPVTSKFSTPPTILRKSRRKQRSRTSSTSFNASLNSSMGSSLDTSTPYKSLLADTNTPQGTPIKALPFSPSQFLNVSGTPAISSTPMQLTSTPIGGNHSQATPTMLTKQPGTFRTPRIRRELIESTPRTPTPFKDALAAIKKMPHTPNQLADISEIIAKDEREGLRAKIKREAANQGEASPSKRVRKSLSSCMQGDKENVAKMDKHDDGDESVLASTLLMSPPIGCMTQNTALSSVFSAKSLNEAFNISTTPSPVAVRKAGRAMWSKVKGQPSKPASCTYFKPTDANKDTDWWKVTCGQTKDQQYMSSQARRMVLREHKPRSLKL